MASSSDDDNPYDFALKYRKLLNNRKTKLLLNKQSNDDEKSNQIDHINSDDNSTVTAITTTASTYQLPVTRSTNRRTNLIEYEELETPTVIGPIITIGDLDESYDKYELSIPKVIKDDDDDDIVSKWQKKNAQDDEDAHSLAKVNRVMNVKVFWRKTQTHRFPLRMFQSIESIYKYFAKLENIHISHVSLELNKKPLTPSDTPNSINYKIIDFIDGDIEFYKSPFDANKVMDVKELLDDEVKFRIIQSDVKLPMFMSMKKTDKMHILYVKLAEKLGLDLDSFTLKFDGDKIKNVDTMESLNVEGGECFELVTTTKTSLINL